MEPRRREAPRRRAGAGRRPRRPRRLARRRTAASWSTRYARLYVPRNDPRWLRRNALVALGNVGGPEQLPVLAAIAAGDDEIEREHAAWAVERIESRA